MTPRITTKTDINREIGVESGAEGQPVLILPLGGTLRSKEGGPVPDDTANTLYGRILARYEFRRDESGVSVWLHDRDDPQARAIEIAFDPSQPDEVLWVHSYPNAPFSQIVYGAAAHLWLERSAQPCCAPPDSRPFDTKTHVNVPFNRVAARRRRNNSALPVLPLVPEDVRLRQALHAYRDMRAMEDAAHLRAACRAEAQTKKAERRTRLWGLGRFARGRLRSRLRSFFARGL